MSALRISAHSVSSARSADRQTWVVRLVAVLLPAAALAQACGEDDSGPGQGSPTCPGASTVCPEECAAQTLPALSTSGCIGPEVASCRAPKPPVTKDAGCVKRDADGRLFQVMNGGWPTVDGFEECTAEEVGKLMSAPACP